MRNRKMTVLMAGLVFTMLGVGCDGDRTQDTATAPASPAPTATATPSRGMSGVNVSVADITGNWTNYEGKTVTVVADIEEVITPRAFTLENDAPAAGGDDDELLVLSPKASDVTEVDDQWVNNRVRVTGVVQRFTPSEVEREIGWDLNPQLEAEYRGNRPVLIARSIEREQ